jgi:hypothetical protein
MFKEILLSIESKYKESFVTMTSIDVTLYGCPSVCMDVTSAKENGESSIMTAVIYFDFAVPLT